MVADFQTQVRHIAGVEDFHLRRWKARERFVTHRSSHMSSNSHLILGRELFIHLRGQQVQPESHSSSALRTMGISMRVHIQHPWLDQPPPSKVAICFASWTKKGWLFAILDAVRLFVSSPDTGTVNRFQTHVSSPKHHHYSFRSQQTQTACTPLAQHLCSRMP